MEGKYENRFEGFSLQGEFFLFLLLHLNEMTQVNQTSWGDHFTISVNEIITGIYLKLTQQYVNCSSIKLEK